jgi:hypothetical protein
MLACRVESSGDHFVDGDKAPFDQAQGRQAVVEVQWVRTVDGWERAGSWFVEPVGRPALHPLLVAAGQLMVSVMGLVVFGDQGGRWRGEGGRMQAGKRDFTQ